MSPLNNGAICTNTIIQLHQNKHTIEGHGFVDDGQPAGLDAD